MNQKQKKQAILWIIKQGFYLYVQGNANILSFVFAPDSVRYLDVISEEKFQTQIQQFSTQNNLPPLRLYIVVGPDALAEKDFVYTNEEEKENEEKKFLDLVPHDHLLFKTWTGERNKIVVINKDICKNIQAAIEKNKGSVESIIPYFIAGKNTPSKDLLEQLFKRTDIFKSENMMNMFVQENKQVNKTIIQDHSNKQKSKLPLLLILFGILLVILVVLIIFQGKIHRF